MTKQLLFRKNQNLRFRENSEPKQMRNLFFISLSKKIEAIKIYRLIGFEIIGFY